MLNRVQLDPVTLCVTFVPNNKHSLPDHWRESHKSEESFHKNIYGEHSIIIPVTLDEFGKIQYFMDYGTYANMSCRPTDMYMGMHKVYYKQTNIIFVEVVYNRASIML